MPFAILWPMARRRTPPRSEVESVLRPLAAIRRRIDRANAERDQLIAAADRHDPRPTNKQIGDELGISEAAVRQIIATLYEPDTAYIEHARRKHPGPGDARASTPAGEIRRTDQREA